MRLFEAQDREHFDGGFLLANELGFHAFRAEVAGEVDRFR